MGVLYADRGKQNEAEQMYSIAVIRLLFNFVDKSKGCSHSHRPKVTEVKTIWEAITRLSDIFRDDGLHASGAVEQAGNRLLYDDMHASRVRL